MNTEGLNMEIRMEKSEQQDNKLQEEVTETENILYYARKELDKISDKLSSDYLFHKKQLETSSIKLDDIRKKISGKTVLFSETMYFIRCGSCGCGDMLGAYYTKPPEEYKCDLCDKTTKIEHEIARRPTQTYGIFW